MVLDDHGRRGERPIDVADDLADLADDVARSLVHQRRFRGHRGLGVDDGGERVIGDPDHLGRVRGAVRVCRDDRDDRLAHVTDLTRG